MEPDRIVSGTSQDWRYKDTQNTIADMVKDGRKFGDEQTRMIVPGMHAAFSHVHRLGYPRVRPSDISFACICLNST